MIDVEAAYAELRELRELERETPRRRWAWVFRALDAHIAAGGGLPQRWQPKAIVTFSACGTDHASDETKAALVNLAEAGVRHLQQREAVADAAHVAWSGWMKYQFDKSQQMCDAEGVPVGLMVPQELVERRRRQMTTAYAELPENEKESDRKEADRYLAAMRGAR